MIELFLLTAALVTYVSFHCLCETITTNTFKPFLWLVIIIVPFSYIQDIYKYSLVDMGLLLFCLSASKMYFAWHFLKGK